MDAASVSYLTEIAEEFVSRLSSIDSLQLSGDGLKGETTWLDARDGFPGVEVETNWLQTRDGLSLQVRCYFPDQEQAVVERSRLITPRG